MEIPYRLARSLMSHCRRVADNAKCDPADHRTADCLRLLRKELSRLGRIITEHEQNIHRD